MTMAEENTETAVDWADDSGLIDHSKPVIEDSEDAKSVDDSELETEADEGNGDDAGESDAGETESAGGEEPEEGQAEESEVAPVKLAKASKHDAELNRIQRELNKPLPKKPELDDFADYEEYEDARAEYRLDLRERRKLEERAKELNIEVGQMIDRNLNAAETVMAKRHKDYKQVEKAFFRDEGVYTHPAVVELLKLADTPVDAGRIVYNLGKNLEAVQELLSSANPFAAAIQLQAMVSPRSERVAKVVEKEKVEVLPRKPVSKPVKAGGNGSKLNPFEKNLPFSEFEKRVDSDPKLKKLFQRY